MAAVQLPPEQPTVVHDAVALHHDGTGAIWVGGFFLPDVLTTFDTAMSATVLPVLADINPAAFLPSSRSAAPFLRMPNAKAMT